METSNINPYNHLDFIDSIANENKNILDFGETKVASALAKALDKHNKIVSEISLQFCAVTKNPSEEVDGRQVNFRMEVARLALGWDREWLETHKVYDIAMQYTLAQLADVNHLKKRFTQAFFNPYNREDYKDAWSSKEHPLRAFYNGDEDSPGHSHYSCSADLDESIVRAVIDNVKEHGTKGKLILYINRAQEPKIWNMDGYFRPILPPDITITAQERFKLNRNLDICNTVYRSIGTVGDDQEVDVWVKDWVPAKYFAVVDTGTEARIEEGEFVQAVRPVMYRYRPEVGKGLYFLLQEGSVLESYTARRVYGITPYHREMAAMHQIETDQYVWPIPVEGI